MKVKINTPSQSISRGTLLIKRENPECVAIYVGRSEAMALKHTSPAIVPGMVFTISCGEWEPFHGSVTISND